jgi:hypothetical protein
MTPEDSTWLTSAPELTSLRAETRAPDAVHEAGHALVCAQLEGSVTGMDLVEDEGGRGCTACGFEGQPSGEYCEWPVSELQLAARDLTALGSGGVPYGWACRHVTMTYAGWVAQILAGTRSAIR